MLLCMSSGPKYLVNNTRERLVSTDFNRLQNFAAADSAETMRCLCNDIYNHHVSAGNVTRQSAVGTPLSGDVIGGLLVRPQIASTSLLIDEGKLGCYFPDAVPSTDDSQYKIVSSPGVAAIGTLVIAANGGAGIRIDVIECQPVENIEEVDNRNIFDPGTGTFANAAVNKVIATRLQFRVRQGVAGAGYPGHAAGWLPLAIASVPVGSVNNDTVTFWDVRPLVEDRINAPYNTVDRIFHPVRNLTYSNTSVPAEYRVYGNVETSYGAYKAGGNIWKTGPTTVMGTGDLEYVDLNSAETYESTYVVVNGKPWYLYVLFPEGLPRWVRYTENDLGGAGRVPCSFRGILTLSNEECLYNGWPVGNVTPPTITGLTAACDTAICIASGTSAAGNHLPYVSDGCMTHLNTTTAVDVTPTASALGTDDYSLISGDHYPANARKLRIQVYSKLTGVAGTRIEVLRSVTVRQFIAAINSTVVIAGKLGGTLDGAGEFTDYYEVEIPMVPALPNLALTTRNIICNYVGVGFTGRANSHVYVVGWELGP